MSPQPGSTLPADPTLYVFLPAPSGRSPRLEVEAVAGDEALPVEVEVASQTDALTVLRVMVRTGQHRSVTLRMLTAPVQWQADFAVEPGRPRVTRGPVRLRSAHHELDEWTCSFTDAWLLAPGTDADAYRVEWASTPSAWERGAQASAIFPRSEVDLWSQRAQPVDAARPPSIALGHVSCFAYTIPEPAVRGPLYVKVTGLYADGGETAAWPTPRRLDADGKESPRPIRHAPERPAPPEVAASAPPPAPESVASIGAAVKPATVSSRSWPAFAALIGCVLVLTVAARRLCRAPRVAPPPR